MTATEVLQMTRHLLRILGGAILALGLATPSQAEKIGNPFIQTYLWGIDDLPPTQLGPGGIGGPGDYGPLLDYAAERDLVNGAMERSVQIGLSSSGAPVFAKAGIANDGDTFWVSTDTARTSSYRGSEAQVLIAQSFRKDSEDARLTYTYSFARVASFFDIEQGTTCKPGTSSYCLQAGLISLVEVEAKGSREVLDADFNKMLIWSSPTGFDYVVDGSSPWPWEVVERGIQGYYEIVAQLSQPVTSTIDLSKVAVGQEFEVLHTLWAYAVDTSPDAPGRARAAEALARDPLGGDTGVSFDLSGLTPTNSPTLIPEPQTWAMFMAGLALLVAIGRARRSAHA
jgi:hypothetical protein